MLILAKNKRPFSIDRIIQIHVLTKEKNTTTIINKKPKLRYNRLKLIIPQHFPSRVRIQSHTTAQLFIILTTTIIL